MTAENGNSPKSSAGRPNPEASSQIQGYFVQLPPESTEEEINLIELVRNLMRYKVMITGIILISTVASILIAFQMEPVYRSTVLMAPVSEEQTQGNLSALTGQFGGLASLAGVRFGSDSNKDQAIAMLKSRNFTADFIVDEGLMPVLFNNNWDESTNSWSVENIEDAPTIADGYNLFNEKIRSVTVDDKTSLVTLDIEWNDREQAAQWANRLVGKLNQHMRDRDIHVAERSLEFLDDQLKRNSVIEIQQGIFRLIEHQIELIMLANAREEYAFRILDPAVVADADQFVRPKRRLMVLATLVVSSFLALFVAVIRLSWTNTKQA